jgi:hypothetical protein
MSVEASRRHGPFDTRWPSGRNNGSDGLPAAPPLLTANVAEPLDWSAFSARHVRGRRRHNLRGLSAYAAYRHGLESRGSGPPKTPRLRLVPNEPIPPAVEAGSEVAGVRRLLAAVAAVQVWEDEGGSIPEEDESQGGRHG